MVRQYISDLDFIRILPAFLSLHFTNLFHNYRLFPLNSYIDDLVIRRGAFKIKNFKNEEKGSTTLGILVYYPMQNDARVIKTFKFL